MKIMDLFSGIGGFALGLYQAGFEFERHYFSEIDKHAIANYRYNFKNAEYVGSVTDVRGRRNQADIITFGSPCQDFSVAGKRRGMDGERSSLIKEAIRLVTEIRPSVFIWENVKGTFSSNNGADFWAILQAFTNIGGYRLEWQLLNTNWFLPQNRERIYLVGHLDGRSRVGIFPIQENDRLLRPKIKPNSGRPQTEISTTLKGDGTMKADDTYIVPKNARTLTVAGNSGGLHSYMTLIPHKKQANAKKSYVQWDQSGKGYNSQQDRAYFKNGIMGSIPTSRTKSKINIVDDFKIRRLTEIECERLQGFPDDWTKYGNYEGQSKEISRTQRYKMLGNAVTVNVVQEVGSRLRFKIK